MEKTVGTIIRLTKLTESSLIVHWCTADAGIIKTVAKGGRRAKSSFAGKLDLFIQADLVWSPARTGELHKLFELDVSNYRQALRKSYGQTVAATYFCQLVDHVLEPQVPTPEYYELLTKGLDFLCEQADMRIVRHFEKRIAEHLGISGDGINAAYAIESYCGEMPTGRKACLDVFSE